MAHGPNRGNEDKNNRNGTRHNTTWWDDGDGITHRESYDYDKHGNVSGYHYVQSSDDGEMSYNYHTDAWEDNS